MAHTCPTCSSPCYCAGDITDTLWGALDVCIHCNDLPEFTERIDKYDCFYEDDNE